MDKALSEIVRQRAAGICEYCRMRSAIYRTVFHVDHIIAQQHDGETCAENLALACLHCNLAKGPNIAGLDPHSGELTRLFHPRRDIWTDHFEWSGATLVGRTDVGRTTIRVLALNDSLLLSVRSALLDEGAWPPSD